MNKLNFVIPRYGKVGKAAGAATLVAHVRRIKLKLYRKLNAPLLGKSELEEGNKVKSGLIPVFYFGSGPCCAQTSKAKMPGVY